MDDFIVTLTDENQLDSLPPDMVIVRMDTSIRLHDAIELSYNHYLYHIEINSTQSSTCSLVSIHDNPVLYSVTIHSHSFSSGQKMKLTIHDNPLLSLLVIEEYAFELADDLILESRCFSWLVSRSTQFACDSNRSDV